MSPETRASLRFSSRLCGGVSLFRDVWLTLYFSNEWTFPLSLKIRLSLPISNIVLCSSSSPPPDLKLSFIPFSLLLGFASVLPPSVCFALLSHYDFLSCGLCLFYSHPGKQPDTTTIHLSLCSLCLKISPSFIHQLFVFIILLSISLCINTVFYWSHSSRT